jgi:hypothetical protein
LTFLIAYDIIICYNKYKNKREKCVLWLKINTNTKTDTKTKREIKTKIIKIKSEI